MASLRGLALIFAARVALVASLKTKDHTENSWLFQDLFQLAEDKLRTWHGQTAKDETMALVRGQGANHGQASNAAGKSTASTKRKLEERLWRPTNMFKKKKPTKDFPSASDWCSATVTSNLGGLGPDTSAPAELRYAGLTGVRTAEHVSSIDMVVTALSSYKSKNPERNGFNSGTGNAGCFGFINLDDSEGPTSVDLEFKFVKEGTNDEVHVDFFEFLLYDIDMGKNSTAIESLTIYNDITRYFKSSNAKFSETGTLSDPAGVTFTATTVGTGGDNPQDPNDLTQDQMDKTFIGIYKGLSKIRVTFSITGGTGGRNFLFAGKCPLESTPDVPKCKSGDCIVWGDPHVLTFDAHHELTRLHPNPHFFLRMRSTGRNDVVNVVAEGQFWLVKSDDVHIQGRYNKRPNQNTTVLGGLAVGGPFLQGNTFIVRPLVGKITWNGEEVLSEIGSEFSNDLIEAKYHAGVENVKDGSLGNGLEVTLPGDIKLVVNRLTRGLAVKISMCARTLNGHRQDGQCGNFNGDSKDDVQDVLMQRVQPLRHREALPWREHLH